MCTIQGFSWTEIYFGHFVQAVRPIHVSNSHTKFGWISPNGLGGDSVMDGQTDGRMGVIALSPTLFLKSVGIKIGPKSKSRSK